MGRIDVLHLIPVMTGICNGATQKLTVVGMFPQKPVASDLLKTLTDPVFFSLAQF